MVIVIAYDYFLKLAIICNLSTSISITSYPFDDLLHFWPVGYFHLSNLDFQIIILFFYKDNLNIINIFLPGT